MAAVQCGSQPGRHVTQPSYPGTEPVQAALLRRLRDSPNAGNGTCKSEGVTDNNEPGLFFNNQKALNAVQLRPLNEQSSSAENLDHAVPQFILVWTRWS